jgi:alginate O-acetyltransferase complex protein AlgI
LLFNSWSFILIFLPAVFVIFFCLNQKGLATEAKGWLLMASLIFYAVWNINFLPLIIGSIIFNYFIGKNLINCKRERDSLRKKSLLVFGILVNLSLLGYFKYYDFAISNINIFFSSHIQFPNPIFPIGISFFSFTQISYLIDAYREEIKAGYSGLDYFLYVSFFPYLISGPICYHKEIIPQLNDETKKRRNSDNVARGLFLFSIGLFKKIAIADTLAVIATAGFDHSSTLNFIESWMTSLSYTFQLYFDFSGYTDMAIGIALIFNIQLPLNFNSPYKSLNIREFWRRWHITLSRYLRDYIYIPLGGNRGSVLTTYINIIITFLIAGLWHGAAWTFVFWGFLHGVALVTQRLWQKTGIKLSRLVAWVITFNFINVAWVFFRANSWQDALKVLKGMCGLSGFVLPSSISDLPVLKILSLFNVKYGGLFQDLPGISYLYLGFLPVILFIILCTKNSNEWIKRFTPSWKTASIFVVFTVYSMLAMNKTRAFLYFNF